MKLVQACLCGENTLQRPFNRRESAVKRVQACLSASKDGECSSHYFRCHVNWCKPVYGLETPYNANYTAEDVL